MPAAFSPPTAQPAKSRQPAQPDAPAFRGASAGGAGMSPARLLRSPAQGPGPESQRVRVLAGGPAPTLRAGPGQGTLGVDGPGAPLPAELRTRLESGFNADLAEVRVHQGPAAARLALGYGARAFAYGHHIVLGKGESARDVALMAHEVAHVLQQRAATTVQRCATDGCCGCAGGAGGVHEAEAARAAATVSGGGAYTVTGQAAAGTPQFEGEDEGLLTGAIWSVLEEFAPRLVPIIRRGPEGVLDWIKDKVTNAIRGVVDAALAPVRSVAETGRWLHGHVAPFLASMQEAAARIARNDCKPITDAAHKIEDLAAGLITPVIEKLQLVAGKVGDFLKGVWDKLGAPAWDFIKKYAGAQWDALQELGDWIWTKTAGVRRLGATAWNWLKNKIGIGDGPEGQNGILQWIQDKASTAWAWVQARIAPYKKQITAVAGVVAGIVVMVSPAGPIVLAGAAIAGAIQGIRWIRANLGGGNAIVRARVHAQTVLIPQLIGAINRVTGAITRMAGTVSARLGEFAAGLGRMVGAAAGTALSFLVDAAQWIADKAVELASWAANMLVGVADWIGRALGRLLDFLRPLLDFFGRVGSLIVDIYALPLLLAGALWKKIPACIRDPFVDWIIPLILRQIDIFKELVKDDEAWGKTKTDVMRIVRLVFVTKDLRGAIRATFDLLLRVFNVPMELLVQIKAKALAAWDTVSAAPIRFIKNAVRTVGRGLKLYSDRLRENLLGGLEGWLFGALADKGIERPDSWTNPWDIVKLALSVLGLSMPHLFDLMEKRFDKATVDKLRAAWRMIGRAWDWILDMKDKKPAEVTREIVNAGKEFGKSVLEGIVTWVVERVAMELATMAAAAAATAGLSQVLDAVKRIYRAMKTAVRWTRTILDMVNRALDAVTDIAAGSLEGPAAILHGAMQRATPAVIGFIGDQVGLGGVADEIRSLIDKLRKKVDDAILAIIDGARALFAALVAGARNVARRVFEWWKRRRSVGRGAERHTLLFHGDEDSAELYIESTPRLLRAYLASLQQPGSPHGTPAKLKIIRRVDTKIDTIVDLKKKLRAARAAGKDNVVIARQGDIMSAFDYIGDQLGDLFDGDTYGTEADPIPIDWPGPSTSGYPTMYFGGRLLPANRPKSQRALKAIHTKGQRDETGAEVVAYRPETIKTLPKGEKIGLSPRFFVNVGTKLGPLSRETTAGGGELERRIAPYGFSSEGDGLQLDHAHEIQFGGLAQNDKVENLWPLESSKNGRKGSKLSRAEVEYPKGHKVRIPTLKTIQNDDVSKGKKFFFIIRSTE